MASSPLGQCSHILPVLLAHSSLPIHPPVQMGTMIFLSLKSDWGVPCVKSSCASHPPQNKRKIALKAYKTVPNTVPAPLLPEFHFSSALQSCDSLLGPSMPPLSLPPPLYGLMFLSPHALKSYPPMGCSLEVGPLWEVIRFSRGPEGWGPVMGLAA